MKHENFNEFKLYNYKFLGVLEPWWFNFMN